MNTKPKHTPFSTSIKLYLKPIAVFGLASGITLAQAETGNPRVNQLGYLPNGSKTATYKGTKGPVAWQLKQNGVLIASGVTSKPQLDASSGDTLQTLSFDTVTNTGTGFTLHVGADTSYPFAIQSNLYSAPLYDALRYFYHNRSGIEITTPYTGGGGGSYAPDDKWARPAGHLNMGANKGDYNTPCWAGVSCNYTLSPIKGWYDAGDHGKYVVNGGISAWTLQNMYERTKYLMPQSTALLDGKLNIPESTNGIADILDEARWQVEFMLAMQVPANQPKAGMAHHKVHDVGWTGLPLRPDQDPKARALVQVTTAATLNLAAVAAQAARIWAPLDAAFAKKCLAAAQRAWDAAQLDPANYYNANTYNTDSGGGGYGDENVTDEFFWAAAELYLTTGDAKYLPTLNNRNLSSTGLGWSGTETAGLISLALVPNPQTAQLQNNARQRLVLIANGHLATLDASGYSAALPATAAAHVWGSNGSIVNNLIFLALAYDFTQEDRYATGVLKGLDFLLGRNVFSTAYVTGTGTQAMKNPHHRFWANSIDNKWPTPPPGALSGGPNAEIFVGKSEGAPAGCISAPATCWKDELGAYAVNEITINWNAPYAWLLNFAKDFGEKTPYGPAR